MTMDSRVRRMAIILQNTSTGGWRYTLRLIEGLKQARPDCELTIYLGRSVKKVCGDEAPRQILASLSVMVKPMPWLPVNRARSGLRNLVNKVRTTWHARAYRRWVQELNSFDSILFAWPFGIDCPDCTTPVVFIPHDFNYTHFTGSFVQSMADSQILRQQHAKWLNHAYPIVSTEFIANELKRTFPEYPYVPKVIRLSRLGNTDSISTVECMHIVRGLGITGDYILSLNNLSAHKNLGQLLAGFHYVAQQHPGLKLVLVGYGTEGIRGKANTPYYIDWAESDENVISLGMRSDREVSALIRCSKLVINASLYEAGNGSGLDAWAMGVPVAMSSIPAFLEQIRVLDVRAEVFHPRCCYEMRDAMLRILNHPEEASQNAQYSQDSMKRYSWKDVGSQYLEYLDQLPERENREAIRRRVA